MKKTKLLFAGLFLGLNLSALDTLTQIDFEQDSDGNLNPNIYVPIHWQKDLYSGIGYSSSTTKDIKTVSGFDDSKNAFISNKQQLTINWITKIIGNYSIGIQTIKQKIQNNEFGYIHDVNGVFQNGNDYWLAFDNDIKLDVIKTSLYFDYTNRFDNLFFRVATTISPYTTVDVEQSTIFKPLVSQTGTSDSSTSQDLSYSFKLETFYDTQSIVNFGFLCSYDYSPLKYDISQLYYENNSFIFKKNNIDDDETTIKYIGKIYLDKKVLGDLNPSLGFGQIKIKTKDNKTGDTTNKSENIITIGFEKRF